MEARITTCSFQFVGFKHYGRFDEYDKLVARAFHDLKAKLEQICFGTDTTLALYEPQLGPEHVEGFFYVGIVCTDKPAELPDGAEYLRIDGRYAGARGQIKNMGAIYDDLVRWIQSNGQKQIWPSSLFIERYDFPIPETGLTLEEEVEVLLPIE
ncbi:GyrI-like domain-containing protein [Cohnella thailandensis]|uniref:GyrI-like domain-containing protein n=1 Tax=Cohnella thailandensis TaxID=557557 RepID=A0A841SSF0_9BACL|nr:GyrI-like domain-containing protein [Cohnella thailandensis]MBB6635283.1 GyrI-like domain-containing protein [Cohnella thailandensis]MBP1974660.1 hypothetical protein [Cohnella thailandensis]